MSDDYMHIVAYVNAATDLAEGVERDIKSKSKQVSSNTVVLLSKFAIASRKVQNLLDHVEAQNVKLQ